MGGWNTEEEESKSESTNLQVSFTISTADKKRWRNAFLKVRMGKWVWVYARTEKNLKKDFGAVNHIPQPRGIFPPAAATKQPQRRQRQVSSPPASSWVPTKNNLQKKTFGFGGGGGGGTVHKRRPLVSSPSKRKDDLKGAFKSFTLPSNFHGTTKKITLCSMVPGYHICFLDVFYGFFRIFFAWNRGSSVSALTNHPSGGGDGPNGQTERRRRQRCFVLRKKSF